jgi:hypothetical protein
MGSEDTRIFTVKSNVIENLLSIKRAQEGTGSYTEGRHPLVAIDNTGTNVILFRGGPLKLTVLEIKNKVEFVAKDCIDVVRELHANGQPSF